jgi:hypothetical protein
VNRRTALVMGALPLALTLTLTACGSGRNAQVLQEHTAQDGVNVDLARGVVQVRDVYATPTDITQTQVPAGGSLDLHFHVYNNADSPELMVAQAPAGLAGQGVVAGAVTIAPHSDIWVGGPQSPVTGSIKPLAAAVFVGAYVPLTLQFSNAGHVDLTVPVEDAVLTQS